MKNIIAATDYSELAENAVAYAASVARLNHYQLVLLNDYSIPVHATNARLTGEVIDRLINDNKVLLDEKAAALEEKYDIKAIAHPTFIFIDQAIDQAIAEYKPEMIVMGMEEKSLEQDLFGNTTTSTIKRSNCPVLAVPGNVTFTVPKKVLFACDVLNGASQKILAQVKAVAMHTHAEVEILVINKTIEELQEKAAASAVLIPVNQNLDGITYHYKNVLSDSIIKMISEEIKSCTADLLIMVPQQHGFWDSMVHRSKTRIMASGLSIPLLSIPA